MTIDRTAHKTERVVFEPMGSFELDLGSKGCEALPKLANPGGLEEIYDGPGVYVFVRTYKGSKSTARYVGSAMDVRNRIRQHLEGNPKLMHRLKHETKLGTKAVEVYALRARLGTKTRTKEKLIREGERHMIQELIRRGDGDFLFNENGKKLHTRIYDFGGSRHSSFDGEINVIMNRNFRNREKAEKSKDVAITPPAPTVVKKPGLLARLFGRG